MTIHSILMSLAIFTAWSTGAHVDEIPAAPTPLELGATELGNEPAMSTEGDQCEADTPSATSAAASDEANGVPQLGYCYHDCSPCFTRDDCTTPEFPFGFQCTAIQLC